MIQLMNLTGESKPSEDAFWALQWSGIA